MPSNTLRYEHSAGPLELRWKIGTNTGRALTEMGFEQKSLSTMLQVADSRTIIGLFVRTETFSFCKAFLKIAAGLKRFFSTPASCALQRVLCLLNVSTPSWGLRPNPELRSDSLIQISRVGR